MSNVDTRRGLRETCTLAFDGPGVREHEMDIESLAQELLAFRQLVEQAHLSQNGRHVPIAVKVKGGFHEGSLLVNIVLDYLGPALPLVPDILACIISFIRFKLFLRGKPPKEQTPLEDGTVQIQNADGGTINIGAIVVNLNNSAPVNTALGKFADLQGTGVDSIRLEGGEADAGQEATQIVAADRLSLVPPMEEQIEAVERERELEILTPQVDGKPGNWRFYDLEDSVEFYASVNDENFLQTVREKKRNFQYGDRITARLNEVRRFVSKRRRTDRTVTEVLAYNRPI